jgi:hypothetical protein
MIEQKEICDPIVERYIGCMRYAKRNNKRINGCDKIKRIMNECVRKEVLEDAKGIKRK